MIKPIAAMWHESMEILAKERIRGTNIGMFAWANSLLPFSSGYCLPDIVFRVENWRIEGWMDDGWMLSRSRRSAAKTLDELQLVPDLDPAMTYLSGW
jgi:hypothetical protein